jgi:hypothetical protein
MLVWYRLGPEPIQYPLRQVATIVAREPLADDTPAASIRHADSGLTVS